MSTESEVTNITSARIFGAPGKPWTYGSAQPVLTVGENSFIVDGLFPPITGHSNEGLPGPLTLIGLTGSRFGPEPTVLLRLSGHGPVTPTGVELAVRLNPAQVIELCEQLIRLQGGSVRAWQNTQRVRADTLRAEEISNAITKDVMGSAPT